MTITKDEKKAIQEMVMVQIDRCNYGMLSKKDISYNSLKTLRNADITVNFDKRIVVKNDIPIYEIKAKYAAKKVNGMYKLLKPKLIEIMQN